MSQAIIFSAGTIALMFGFAASVDFVIRGASRWRWLLLAVSMINVAGMVTFTVLTWMQVLR